MPSAARAYAAVLDGRVHGKSSGTKALMYTIVTLGVIAATLAVLVLLPRAGVANVAPLRTGLCLACAYIYWLRLAVTLFYLLQRKVPILEAVSVSLFQAIWAVTACVLSTGIAWPHARDNVWTDLAAFSVYLLGSFVNTFSELQRRWWKEVPSHRGRCCTEGLWTLAVHINYFGDVVLFLGWTALAGAWWLCWVPLAMLLNFSCAQGPELDAYLEERYGEEFTAWRASTAYIIPFVW